MGGIDRRADLARVADGRLDVERALAQNGGKRVAFEVLHDAGIIRAPAPADLHMTSG
jgi:hypothetical protein